MPRTSPAAARAATATGAAAAALALAACATPPSPHSLEAAHKELLSAHVFIAQVSGESPLYTTIPSAEIARAFLGTPPEQLPLSVSVSCTGEGTASIEIDGESVGEVSCDATGAPTDGYATVLPERTFASDADHTVAVTAKPGQSVAATVLSPSSPANGEAPADGSGLEDPLDE